MSKPCSVVVVTMDNFLRPILIKRGADLPLLLIFVGVIGGLLPLGSSVFSSVRWCSRWPISYSQLGSTTTLNPYSAVKPTSPQAQGGTLEQRRRPAVKFQSYFGLWRLVVIGLNLPITEPLIDVCLEAVTHRLRYGRVAPYATL